jgi:serine protease Do
MTKTREIRCLLLVSIVQLGTVQNVRAQQEQAPTVDPPATDMSEQGAEEGPLSMDQISDAMQGVFDRIWVPRSRFTDGPRVREAFRPVVADARHATVQIRSVGQRVALGGIVGPDGWVLTKASLAHGPLTCRLNDGRELPARVVGIDRANDLAMLKIDATGLPTLDLSANKERQSTVAFRPETEAERREALSQAESKSTSEVSEAAGDEVTLRAGDWVATVGARQDPQAIGVVSVASREIPKRLGKLGIGMDINFDGVGALVELVEEKSGADIAGVFVNDVITAVDGIAISSGAELRNAIGGDRNPGDTVELTVMRGEESLTLQAILGSHTPNHAERRAYYQNSLGGKLSKRRFGFELAFQHDSVLAPRDCGGPLVDVEGRVVGFNISRAGRTESYALPVSLVREGLFDLMSGKLAPSPDQPDAEEPR